MSAINTRNKANTIESVAIPAGAIVVGACLVGLVKGLSFLANAALETTGGRAATDSSPRTLQSVAALRSDDNSLKLTAAKKLENLKTEAFRRLVTAPLLISNGTELEPVLLKLDRAQTVPEFRAIHQDVVAKIENSHQEIFTTALLEAGKRAALKIGFAKIESLPSPLSSTARFAATDFSGRSIVTEISAPIGGDARIETEVIGVSDGSCQKILDAFDAALEAEGVRSQPANRKFTGGVCELAAVRDFLNRKPVPKSKVKSDTNDFARSDDTKRRQRLNQNRKSQKQK